MWTLADGELHRSYSFCHGLQLMCASACGVCPMLRRCLRHCTSWLCLLLVVRGALLLLWRGGCRAWAHSHGETGALQLVSGCCLGRVRLQLSLWLFFCSSSTCRAFFVGLLLPAIC